MALFGFGKKKELLVLNRWIRTPYRGDKRLVTPSHNNRTQKPSHRGA